MNLSKAWNANLEAASFLLSKILYKQCGNTSIQNNTEYHGDRLLGVLIICIWLFYIELFKIAPIALFFLTHMVYMANGTCKLTKIPFRFSKYNM